MLQTKHIEGAALNMSHTAVAIELQRRFCQSHPVRNFELSWHAYLAALDACGVIEPRKTE